MRLCLPSEQLHTPREFVPLEFFCVPVEKTLRKMERGRFQYRPSNPTASNGRGAGSGQNSRGASSSQNSGRGAGSSQGRGNGRGRGRGQTPVAAVEVLHPSPTLPPPFFNPSLLPFTLPPFTLTSFRRGSLPLLLHPSLTSFRRAKHCTTTSWFWTSKRLVTVKTAKPGK